MLTEALPDTIEYKFVIICASGEVLWESLQKNRVILLDSEETQALCFFAGANSIFVGDRLLTTDNPGETRDEALMNAMGFEHASKEDTATPTPRRTLIDARTA